MADPNGNGKGYYKPTIWGQIYNQQILPTLVKPQSVGGYYTPAVQGLAKLNTPAAPIGQAGVSNGATPNPNNYPSTNASGLGTTGSIGRPITGQGQGGGKTWRDVAHEQIDSKLGAGWAETFQKAHGMSPVDFYSDKRNWFSYQAQAAQDYGTDSKEFANATIRATVDEGLKHQQEAEMWKQLHGDTPIPPEMWQHWYYINRGESNGPVVW